MRHRSYARRRRRSAAVDVDPALALVDPVVVDARVAPAHVAELVELPVLVAVAAPPLPAGVVALVLEPHGDAVVVEAPELLAQPVVELARPLAAQEVADRVAALEELVAVAPVGVLGVCPGHAVGVARVPGVLGGLHLAARGRLVERRDGRARLDGRHGTSSRTGPRLR